VGAPLGVVATQGPGRSTLSVSWTPGVAGGAPISFWQVTAQPDPSAAVFDEFLNPVVTRAAWTWVDPSVTPGFNGANERSQANGVLTIGAAPGWDCSPGVNRCPYLRLNTWPVGLSRTNFDFETFVKLAERSEALESFTGGIGIQDVSSGAILFQLGIRPAFPYAQVVWQSIASASFTVAEDIQFGAGTTFFPTGQGVYLKIERQARWAGGYQAFWRISPLRAWMALSHVAVPADFPGGIAPADVNLRPVLLTRNYLVATPTTYGTGIITYVDFMNVRLMGVACQTAGTVMTVPVGTTDRKSVV
jgi:hypothetical protein